MALVAMVDPGWWMLGETAAVFVIGDPLVGQIVEPLLFGADSDDVAQLYRFDLARAFRFDLARRSGMISPGCEPR